MDIVLGVSITPTKVRMVLVEGERADGVTVDHDVFDITAPDGVAITTASDQVIAAILGTLESATEGGHHLKSTGVTWSDHAEAAVLREALDARDIDDVTLVSVLHAAGALAQAVGGAVGYDRTALMLIEHDDATLAVIETADGSIVKVQTQSLHSADAVAELAAMVAGLEEMQSPPQGVFIVGSGVDVAAVKSQIEMATALPVSAPEEAELALARGAALASAQAPRFEASTVGLAYAQDPDGTTAGAVYPAALAADQSAESTQMAAADYMRPLGYSEITDDAVADGDDPEGRKPFLLVGSALTTIFVVGVVALVVSLAVSIRPTVDQRPSPGESVIVPSSQAPAPPVPEAQVPAAPSPAPETIQEPVPVVQQAPRTVFVQTPAPAAPAPAAPAPAPPAPAAPPVIPAPAAPVVPYPPVLPPPVIVLPPKLPPVVKQPWNPPWTPPWQQTPWTPPWQQTTPWTPPQQQTPWNPPQQQTPWTPPQQQQEVPMQQLPPRSRGSGSGDYGPGGSGSGGSGSGGTTGSSQAPLWPLFPFGGG